MEKVKLTQEQAEIIEKMEGIQKPFFVSMHARVVLAFDELKELSLDELIKALYIGYEVEPEFEVGDWVVHENGKPIRQIEKVEHDRVNVTDGEDGYLWGISYIRHATPEEIQQEKERRFFNEHGRKPWELKVGDVLVKKMDNFPLVVTEVNAEEITLNLLTCTRSEVKKCCKVLCFADDRLDVSEDE